MGPESLTSDGFIHASPGDQLTRVANKHYNRFNEVRVVCLRADRVRPEILWEPASDNRLYPHIYGPLNMDAAERSVSVKRGRTAASRSPCRSLDRGGRALRARPSCRVELRHLNFYFFTLEVV